MSNMYLFCRHIVHFGTEIVLYVRMFAWERTII